MKLILLLVLYISITSANCFASDLPKVYKPIRPESEITCAFKGGEWVLFPMGNFYFCSIHTTDAGKLCTDNNQCQGDCIPTGRSLKDRDKLLGRCAPELETPGGCPEYLVNGKVITEPCI